MGALKKDVDSMAKNKNKRTAHHESWRKRTPSKVDLSRPMMTISHAHRKIRRLPCDIHVWTAWSMFDIKLVRFEINDWMRAAGLFHGFRDRE